MDKGSISHDLMLKRKGGWCGKHVRGEKKKKTLGNFRKSHTGKTYSLINRGAPAERSARMILRQKASNKSTKRKAMKGNARSQAVVPERGERKCQPRRRKKKDLITVGCGRTKNRMGGENGRKRQMPLKGGQRKKTNAGSV